MNFLRSSYKGGKDKDETASPSKSTASPKKSSSSRSNIFRTPTKTSSMTLQQAPPSLSPSAQTRRTRECKKIARIQWSDPMDNALVDALVEQVNLGRKSDIGFKPEAYKATISEIFIKCGVELENKHISNRLRTLKKLYWAVRDMVNASGFGWDADRSMVVATDDVWDGYISSHPYAERVRGKHIQRYSDLEYLFGNDCAHGAFATTAYSSPLSSKRRGRDELDSDEGSDDNGTATVRLSSDSDDDHVSGAPFHPKEVSQHRSKRMQKGSMETSYGSKNSQSTASGISRGRKGKSSDHIGDRMGEMAEAVKTLTITMATSKTMTRLQTLLDILEEVDGLSHEDQVRAARLMKEDIVSAGFFIKMGHERRKEWVEKLLDRNPAV